MLTRSTPHVPATSRARRLPAGLSCLALSVAAFLIPTGSLLISAGSAYAGTEVIDNCPATPTASINAGPWGIFGSPQADQATCAGASGAFIGPAGAYLSPNSSAGVSVNAPSGFAIRKATVWWYVAADTGAPSFADASTNAGVIGQAATPLDDTSTPETFELPSSTTSFTLMDYCSSGDGPTGCSFSEDSPILKLLGAQLTVEDSNLPSGSATGGALTSTSALTGNQALAYSVADPDSGVRLVKLLIDGSQIAENNYLPQCPYESFLACPANISDTISWNTATVADGEHSLEAIVQDAAQNTSVFYTATITTHNAPTNTMAPAITAPGQPAPGTTLTVQPGSWATPAGAGPAAYTYQWQDCNPEGSDCQAIPGAQSASYTPATGDAGHTLRALVTATDNDGSTSQATAATSAIPAAPATTSTPGAGAGTATGGTLGTPDTPNGISASEAAVLHLTTGNIAKPFAKSAFKLAGQLTNSQGQPIANATLDILQRTEGTNTPTVIEHATTSPTGAFSVTVPAGPSRLIEVTYRAFADDASDTASATVAETVQAGVHLKITRPRTGPTGTIDFIGKVQGPIPHHGVLVKIVVHYRGRWVPIRTPRTNSLGYFHAEYTFQGSIGRFPFYAETPFGQANFPYAYGRSNIVDVPAE
jgi:hypothetical protein